MNFNELAIAVYEILVGELDNGSEAGSFFSLILECLYNIQSHPQALYMIHLLYLAGIDHVVHPLALGMVITLLHLLHIISWRAVSN